MIARTDLSTEPLWAIAFAVLLALVIVWIVIQIQLDRVQDPDSIQYQLVIAAFDYSMATEWCYRNGVSPRWPNVHIVTKKHHTEGFCLTEDDLIIDLHASRTVIALLRAGSPRTPVERIS